MRTAPDSELMSQFAVFILTHGRPDNVITYQTLRKIGYTGRIFLIVDNLDKNQEKYKEKYGDEVVIFDKPAVAKTFDQGDNFADLRSVIYARNACFDLAEKLGVKYFIQLDDDYTSFQFRFDNKLDYRYQPMEGFDRILMSLVRFYIVSGCHSVAIAQGGDFMGGEESTNAQNVRLMRKCMNSFVCSTERPFKFMGRLNDDVNTYVHMASIGLLMFTTNQISLQQAQTQTNPGGLTELYLDFGTYVKSFYSVMYQPSSVRVKMLMSNNPRIHHAITWRNTAPMILREDLRKP